MVCHQAIALDRHTVFPAKALEKVQVCAPIIVDKEHILPVIPPLRNVMGQARYNDAR